MNNITYVTYQTFPANTANSLQTITNLKFLVKRKHNVRLIFPNRSLDSSSDLKTLQSHYQFSEFFEINMLGHNLPFRDYKGKALFKKIRFHLSHYLWSKKAYKFIESSNRVNDIFITRSDWLFYFLAKKNKKVIFECHQVSRLRIYLIKKCLKFEKIKIIFTHPLLLEDFKIDENYNEKCEVIHNAYDEDFFDNKIKKKGSNTVIFVGNLLRFGKTRSIEFFIDAFNDSRLSTFNLKVIGGPSSKSNKYKELVKKKNIKNIKFLGHLPRSETLFEMQQAKIGLLINSSESKHSLRHTSPLKYFEYLRAKLQIVAVDFPSHRELPFNENIIFFDEDNKEMFIQKLYELKDIEPFENTEYEEFSYSSRIKKIEKIIARLEGLEPPTL
ncbi:glycosyltransferase [Acidimicrobiia bacterium]|nr:glycosyltransferase [Acidimicrobiia bacterium]